MNLELLAQAKKDSEIIIRMAKESTESLKELKENTKESAIKKINDRFDEIHKTIGFRYYPSNKMSLKYHLKNRSMYLKVRIDSNSIQITFGEEDYYSEECYDLTTSTNITRLGRMSNSEKFNFLVSHITDIENEIEKIVLNEIEKMKAEELRRLKSTINSIEKNIEFIG